MGLDAGTRIKGAEEEKEAALGGPRKSVILRGI